MKSSNSKLSFQSEDKLFANFTHFSGPFSGWLLLLTGIHFTRDYLNLSQWAKRLNRILFGFQVLTILMGIVAIGLLVFAPVIHFGILYNFGFVLAVLIIDNDMENGQHLPCYYPALKNHL